MKFSRAERDKIMKKSGMEGQIDDGTSLYGNFLIEILLFLLSSLIIFLPSLLSSFLPFYRSVFLISNFPFSFLSHPLSSQHTSCLTLRPRSGPWVPPTAVT